MKGTTINLVVGLCTIVIMNSALYAQFPYPEETDLVDSRPAFEALEHDFGVVFEGQELTHTFTVTNSGTEPLLLEHVRPTCGCTAREYTSTPIQPGESGFITTITRTTRMIGQKTKTVQVTTNSIHNPRIILKLRFNSISIVQISPMNLAFGRVHLTERREFEFTIERTPEVSESIELMDVSELDLVPFLSIPQPRFDEATQKYTIRVRIEPEKLKQKIIRDAIVFGRFPSDEDLEYISVIPFRTRLGVVIRLTGLQTNDVNPVYERQMYCTGMIELTEDIIAEVRQAQEENPPPNQDHSWN